MELAAELKRRKASLPRLKVRRTKLKNDLAGLEEQIAQLEQLSPTKGGTKTSASSRPRRTGPTLRDRIATVLGTDPMRPVEIARALVSQKLHDGTKSLHIQVSQVLAKSAEFKNVRRGQWVNKANSKKK